MVTEPQESFAAVPIPAEAEPPTADSEPSESAWIVTFDPNEQPIPAAPGLTDENEDGPIKTKRAVLLEIFTAAVVLRMAFVNTRVRFASETQTE
jgi:hypothetical protein